MLTSAIAVLAVALLMAKIIKIVLKMVGPGAIESLSEKQLMEVWLLGGL